MSLETIETGLRHVLRDTDGRLYAPITPDHNRPYVYLPGLGLFYAGYEIHNVTVYLDPHGTVSNLELLCDNGYVVGRDEPVIARLIEQLA